jgi:hypothetical protein
MGASVAALAAISLSNAGWALDDMYFFGMSRTGDHKFAQVFEDRFGGHFYRVTHGKDPVPNLPPDHLIVDWVWEHIEPEIYYAGDVEKGFQVCTTPHEHSCVEQYYILPFHLPLNLPDHLGYMGVDTSIFGCGESVSLEV